MASDQTVSGKPPSKLSDLPTGRHRRPYGTRYFDSDDDTNDRLPSPEPDKAGSGKSPFVPSGVTAKLAAYQVMTSTASCNASYDHPPVLSATRFAEDLSEDFPAVRRSNGSTRKPSIAVCHTNSTFFPSINGMG